MGNQFFVKGAVAIAATSLLLTGCARYDQPTSAPFAPVPEQIPMESGPRTPTPEPQDPNQPPGEPQPLPGACGDLTPGVIAGCLDTTGDLVMLPGGESALVAERLTGRILRVSPGAETTEYARVPVEPAGDGGLTGIALSPTFEEDQLVFAYITTPSDNRVVRVAPGDSPKEIFTGIPKGPTGNAGAIAFAAPDQLMILTGDTGNPAAANDPGSMAGKLLRLNSTESGAPAPQQVSAGMGSAGGLCLDPQSGSMWVTDRAPTMDRLQIVVPDGTSATQVWTWADQPGVGGCAAAAETVVVALDGAKALSVVVSGSGGAVLGDPQLIAQDLYGSYGAAAFAADGTVWVATVNKSGPEAAPTDDRVVRIEVTSGVGGLV
ncbi:PQQ-dependent sugar dehydrogenase [Tomitella biformata]|uniref:PQQ-dependent sugar dehydrogenase n=1 Tax=Tomitella biformata TaxID=630403 RepID=UPI0004656E55|nr:PQQ-dependent sugar dehydrogenase [Tomitella biformata]